MSFHNPELGRLSPSFSLVSLAPRLPSSSTRLTGVCIIIKLRQPLAKLGESCVGVILEVVILQGLKLPVDAALPGRPVQNPPLSRVLGAN